MTMFKAPLKNSVDSQVNGEGLRVAVLRESGSKFASAMVEFTANLSAKKIEATVQSESEGYITLTVFYR